MMEDDLSPSTRGCIDISGKCGFFKIERQPRITLREELLRLKKEHLQIKQDFTRMLSYIDDCLESEEFTYNLFVNKIKDAPQIERIYARKENEVITFIIITKDRDIETEDIIIDAFAEVIRKSKKFTFDFQIIPRLKRKFQSVKPEKSYLLYS